MSQVKVIAHPETGNVITPSSKSPEFGTFRVDTENRSLENGFVNITKRSAFIRGKLTDLAMLNLSAGQALPGRIQRKESFEPFYENQEPKMNPSTGEIVLTDGKQTYLEFVYTSDAKSVDVWVTSQEVTTEPAETASAQAQQAV
jgi:hypothetical protein